MIIVNDKGEHVCKECGRNLQEVVNMLGAKRTEVIHCEAHHRDLLRTLFRVAMDSSDPRVVEAAKAVEGFESEHVSPLSTIGTVAFE